MLHDIRPDWKLGAERWSLAVPPHLFDAPEPEDVPPTVPGDAKLSRRARCAIIGAAALGAWALFAAIGWGIVALIRLLSGI